MGNFRFPQVGSFGVPLTPSGMTASEAKGGQRYAQGGKAKLFVIKGGKGRAK